MEAGRGIEPAYSANEAEGITKSPCITGGGTGVEPDRKGMSLTCCRYNIPRTDCGDGA